MNKLALRDILALGFMTFALFVGAGNIIFPPIIGYQAGNHVWIAALGFMITAVGLPVLTIIAIARVGGLMETLSSPTGKFVGTLLAVVCYLAVGPLFATPRTASISFEVGIQPLVGGESHLYLFIYSVVFFALVAVISLYPGRILDFVGRILAPIKILALAALGIAAFMLPAGSTGQATSAFVATPLSQGFVNGYLTMDTLGALVFGIVVVKAIQSRNIESQQQITRYSIIAALIAGLGLMLVYFSLFKLGSGSQLIAAGATNGAEILHAYVQHTFGLPGSLFLALLISLACMVTAIGLTCACAEYFSMITPLSYRALVGILVAFSLLISNLGLTELIKVSIPVLTALYPPCIVLVLLSFINKYWHSAGRVVTPVMGISFLFGIFDGLNTAGLTDLVPAFISHIPLNAAGLAWIVPSVLVFIAMGMTDKLAGPREA